MSYTFGVEGCGHVCSDCAVVKMFTRKYLTEEKPALEAEITRLKSENSELKAQISLMVSRGLSQAVPC